MEIRIDKAMRGIEEISVCGAVGDSDVRAKAIEEAIKLSQEDPSWWGKASYYFGVKNYAHFGDQRADCQRGSCPRHGSIVFRIQKTIKEKDITDDGVYLLLLCVENPMVDVSSLLNKLKETRKYLDELKSKVEELKEWNA